MKTPNYNAYLKVIVFLWYAEKLVMLSWCNSKSKWLWGKRGNSEETAHDSEENLKVIVM